MYIQDVQWWHAIQYQVFKYLIYWWITEYGGLGLDYTYSVAMGEALGNVTCGAIPMAIAVQTDMATPALARYFIISIDITI